MTSSTETPPNHLPHYGQDAAGEKGTIGGQGTRENAAVGHMSSLSPTSLGDDPPGTDRVCQLWRCDFCLVATFLDYDEACRHEEQCRRQQQRPTAPQKAAHGEIFEPKTHQQDSLARSHPFFQKKGARKSVQPAPPPPPPEQEKKAHSAQRKRPTGASSVNKAQRIVEGRNVIDLLTCSSSSSRGADGNSSSSSSSSEVILVKEQPAKAKSVVTEQDEEVVLVLDTATRKNTRPNAALLPRKKKLTNQTLGASLSFLSTTTTTTSLTTTSALQKQDALMSQAIFEFRQERRRREQEQKERQLARQRQREEQHPKQSTSSSSPFQTCWAPPSAKRPRPDQPPSRSHPVEFVPRPPSQRNSADQLRTTPPRCKWPAVPFPSSSHIMGLGAANLPFTVPELCYPSWVGTFGTYTRAEGMAVKTINSGDDDDLTYQHWRASPHLCPAPVPDPLSQCFSNLWAQGIRVAGDKAEDDTRAPALWSDLYSIKSIPDDVCGTDRQQVALELQNFVQTWMKERHKALRHMSAKQQSLSQQTSSKANKKRKPKKYTMNCYDDEDDLWCDSDDEESLRQRKCLCLLTGPVGSGKTSLVHAVVKSLGCNLLEINTSKERGAVVMRKELEEATRSLSSRSMFQHQGLAPDQQRRKDMEESDNDGDQAPMASVTVLLMDEVDILFDQKGDHGFWPALADLARRSRCPIFLTANAAPAGLLGLSLPYVHYEVSKPSVADCVDRVIVMMQQEGFLLDPSTSQVRYPLERFSELCACDLRRITLELQARATCPGQLRVPPATVVKNENVLASKIIQGKESLHGQRPIVKKIEPAAVQAEQYSLLTITGSNFMNMAKSPSLGPSGYPVRVFVGAHLCPQARIMNDSTILAVSAPWKRQPDVDESGMKVGTRLRSLTAGYPPITVEGCVKTGLFSSCTGVVQSVQLVDGSKFACLVPSPCFEYHFSSARSLHSVEDDFDTDNEFEDGPNDCLVRSSLSSVKNSLDDGKLIGKLLKEGIDQWIEKNGGVPTADPSYPKEKDETDAWKLFCLTVESASDSALLEDVGLRGFPVLSGPCMGFGFDLTDEYPKSSNEKSNFPTHDRMFTLGWNENAYFYGDNDTYMVLPSAAERTHLRRNFDLLRGVSAAHYQDGEASDKSDEGKSTSKTECSEEDMYLPPPTPEVLLELPSILSAISLQQGVYDRPSSPKVESKTEEGEDSMIALLREYIFPLDQERLGTFTRGLAIAKVDKLLPFSYKIDPSVHLDYLPMLRNMAIHERAFEEASKTICNQEEFSSALGSRRRQTRSSSRRNNTWYHYFETVSPAFQWNGANKSARQVGELLASAALIF